MKPVPGLQDFPASLQTQIWFLTEENKYERLAGGTSLFRTGIVQKAVGEDGPQHVPNTAQHTSFVQRVLEHIAYLAEEQGNHGLGQHCAAVTTEH